MEDYNIQTQITHPTDKSIRVILPFNLYKELKLTCPDHGMISQLVRHLLEKHFESLKG